MMDNIEPIVPAPITSNFEHASLLDVLPNAVIFLDQSGTIMYANARAITMMGGIKHELFGSILWQSIPYLAVTPLYDAVEKAMRTDQSYSVIFPCPGTYARVHVNISPFNAGVILLFQEEMPLIPWQEETHNRERWYQILRESIADLVAVLTPQGLILDINQHPLINEQIRREDIIGTPFSLLPSWLHAPAAQHLLNVAIEQACRGETVSFEAKLHPNRGREVDLTLTLTPHLDRCQHVKYIVCVGLDITERTQREQRKDDFLSMISHERRTPLTSLKLQTQLLKRKLKKYDEALVNGPLSLMETQINAVIRLEEDSLDFSKIQADSLSYIQEPILLDEVLREKVEIVRQLQDTHTIVMNDLTIPSPLVIGDRDRLGQVMLNLINNAIKYSPDAKTIKVNMVTYAERVTVSVHDHGIGIHLEQQEEIFKLFHRAVAPGKVTIPGLGIGLYIVSEIVKRHGGNITVESEPEKGSTFHVTFPLYHR